LLNHASDFPSRAGFMLQAVFRIVDVTVVALILSAFT
jgi:hypothetical protein